MIGERLSHYNVTDKLGAGGMGEVYLADDTRLDRKVALKFLPASVRDDADAKQRLIREAKAASKLDHPNIVTIHGIEEDNGRLFIVMAHVNGTTLDKYLTSMGREHNAVVDLAMQILDGVGSAHEAGVVHRDLKPGNILVDERERIRILDFGLARLKGTERLTQVGSTVGTLAYSPPEMVHGEDATSVSDIYSFGVVLYQMLTGDLPFESTHEAALLYSILNEEPRPLSDHDPTIPAKLQKIVLRCLNKSPERRYQSCQELSQALRDSRKKPETESKTQPSTDIPSIAVLPFVNRSRNEDDEYFADGLADELLNLLAKIRGLRVAAQTSTFQFKGKNEDLAVIGQKLNVATLLEGSVRKSGNRVRISVQLVKVSDGYHLWSESYDRTLEDIFEVQDDIAQAVVKELRTTLLGEEENSNTSRELKAEIAKAAKGRAQIPEAQRLFMLAKHLIDRWSHDDVANGLEYLQQALALDPDYALAWTVLGSVYAFQANHAILPLDEGFGKAREAAERALALEPDLAEAHATLGYIQENYDWDWSGAEASYKRALELAPGNALVLSAASRLSGNQCRNDEAIALGIQALEQDPLSATAHTRFAVSLARVGRFAEAETALRKSLELAPGGFLIRTALARILLEQGRAHEALAMLAGEPDEAYRLYGAAIINHKIGHTAEAMAAFNTLVEKYATDAAFQIALVYGAFGEADAAFAWLERSYSQRDPGLAGVRASMDLKSLHDDPRWPVFMKKMGF